MFIRTSGVSVLNAHTAVGATASTDFPPTTRPSTKLSALRCAGEVAANTGAIDATVAHERGGDLTITTSLAGTFPLRTIGVDSDVQLAAVIAGNAAWLDHYALAALYLPPHANVLAFGITTEDGRGVALLRYDTRPTISVDDIAFMRRALSSAPVEEPLAA